MNTKQHKERNKATDHSKMDHGDMDHSKMNHSDMDHSKMDHSNMDHGGMNHGDMRYGTWQSPRTHGSRFPETFLGSLGLYHSNYTSF